MTLNRIFLLLMLTCLTFFYGCYPQPEPQKDILAVPVRMIPVEQKDVQLYSQYTGKTDVNSIDIVPRILGTLEEICFFPGDIVEKDDVLFKIEQFDYQNAVQGCQADLDAATAKEFQAKADYDRNINLRDNSGVQGVVTQQEIDSSRAIWEEATANVAKAKTALVEAEKNLERTVITAPMRGKITREMIEKGNLVDGTSGKPPVLATIRPMDQMFVYFQITDTEFDRFQTHVREYLEKELGDRYHQQYKNMSTMEIAQKENLEEPLEFDMGLLTNDWQKSSDPFPFHGKINYNDNMLDIATGTITVRGEIDNQDYRLYPGFPCVVRIKGPILPQALVIQEKAVCNDLNNQYVWVVKDNMPEKRTIERGESLEDGTCVVLSGLNPGEVYIVDGVQKVKGNVPVTESKEDPLTASPSATPDSATPDSAANAGSSSNVAAENNTISEAPSKETTVSENNGNAENNAASLASPESDSASEGNQTTENAGENGAGGSN